LNTCKDHLRGQYSYKPVVYCLLVKIGGRVIFMRAGSKTEAHKNYNGVE